jgi:hypothetical protein
MHNAELRGSGMKREAISRQKSRVVKNYKIKSLQEVGGGSMPELCSGRLPTAALKSQSDLNGAAPTHSRN